MNRHSFLKSIAGSVCAATTDIGAMLPLENSTQHDTAIPQVATVDELEQMLVEAIAPQVPFKIFRRDIDPTMIFGKWRFVSMMSEEFLDESGEVVATSLGVLSVQILNAIAVHNEAFIRLQKCKSTRLDGGHQWLLKIAHAELVDCKERTEQWLDNKALYHKLETERITKLWNESKGFVGFVDFKPNQL